jgi:glycosyltransferase involved in cell wall biosynthesis
MRIGIVTQWPFPDSAEHRTWKIVNTLVGAGHEITVFTARKTAERLAIGSGIVYVRSPWPEWVLASANAWKSAAPMPGNPCWAIWLFGEARRLRLDCLMSKELRLGLSTYWAARAAKSRFWIDLCENYPGMVRIERSGQLLMPLHASVAAFLEKQCGRAADLVTVVTESNRERLVRHGVSESSLVVVSNTPILEKVSKRNGAASPGKLNLVYAGMLSKIRGLERLLKALGRMGPHRESIRLHVAGEGSERKKLQLLANSLELTDSVQFRGWVPREELSALFLRCDVGVIPHLLTDLTHTTTPNKLFDYMACGLPVWTTSMRPCREIIEAADCGWVSEDSVDGMAAALRQLLSTTEEERHSKGERGRQAVHSSYNWNVDSRRMLDALSSLA